MDIVWKPKISIFWGLLLVLLVATQSCARGFLPGFQFGSGGTIRQRSKEAGSSSQCYSLFLSPRDLDHKSNGDLSSHHPMADTSFLSHVMLRVPSVDQTVKYWTQKGGRIRMSRAKDEKATNGNYQLMSAFVELGCARGSASSSNDDGSTDDESSSPSPPVCFALELVSTSKSQDSYTIGNAISYIGVSMLLQFQNNLLGAITGMERPESQGDEPNGIRVQSAASAPGDFLARLALTSNSLGATHNFYATVLGMKVMAQDETMLCLRYDNLCFSGGVPTTLVFDALEEGESIKVGDCFDHLVIATSTPVEDLCSRFLEEEQCKGKIFMKPTDMFGKTVMGVIDPNGYKVIIASS